MKILELFEPPFTNDGKRSVFDANGIIICQVPENWANRVNFAQEIAAALNKAAKFDKIKKHRDILAMHLAEIKAIDDGESHNTIKATMDHCIAEVAELDPCGKNKAAEVEGE